MKAWHSATIRAIRYGGGTMEVSRQLSTPNERVSPQRVSNWLARGRVAGDYVIALERISGISRHKLRPDLFGSK